MEGIIEEINAILKRKKWSRIQSENELSHIHINKSFTETSPDSFETSVVFVGTVVWSGSANSNLSFVTSMDQI
jgi:hypothetical protein